MSMLAATTRQYAASSCTLRDNTLRVYEAAACSGQTPMPATEQGKGLSLDVQ
uniref:U2266h n=1 Tax=Mycobacterium leprae TaxID=1769 RepID=Q50033_MYCLR|nr:u2266h [Mycobacterium leprae]